MDWNAGPHLGFVADCCEIWSGHPAAGRLKRIEEFCESSQSRNDDITLPHGVFVLGREAS
jgi:hypothetical protein